MTHQFRLFSISKRLQFLALLGFVGIVIVAAYTSLELRDALFDQRRIALQDQVQSALGIVKHNYQLFKDGKITEEEARQRALATISSLRYDNDKGYMWVNDMHPRVLMHPLKPAIIGKDMSNSQDAKGKHHWREFVKVVRDNGSGFVSYTWEHKQSGTVGEKVSFLAGFEPWGWIVGSGVLFDGVNAVFYQNVKYTALASVAIAFILVVISLSVGRSITRPITSTIEAMQEIASGDGDLTQRLPTDGKDELTKLAGAFNLYTEKIQDTVRRLSKSTQELVSASEKLSAVTQSTHDGLDQQQSETQQVASSMTQMSATVKEIARSSEEALQAVIKSDENAHQGNSKVNEVNTSIKKLVDEVDNTAQVIEQLNQESDRIGGVLDVIQGIAEQTNLLALNAAIEAARAGEHGRGFAVVADEVRTLASQTEQSTKEIQSMVDHLRSGSQKAVSAIENSRGNSQDTLELAKQAGESLTSIVDAVATIKDMNSQIATAAEQQSAVADQIENNVLNISNLSQQSSINAGETATTSEQFALEGANLRKLVGQFKID